MAGLQISLDKCIKCTQCVNVCPNNSIKYDNGKLYIDDFCTSCGLCIPKCPLNAIDYYGNFSGGDINKDDYNGILIMGEQREGKIHSVVLELLGEGKRLAKQLNTYLSVVLLGKNTDKIIKELFAFGADYIYQIDHPLLESFNDELYTDIIVQVLLQYKPQIFLIGSTAYGSSLAPRIASRLNTGLTADCTSLEIDIKKRLLRQTRPAFGGNLMATIVCPKHRPQMCTVKPRVMKSIEPDYTKYGKVIRPDVIISDNLKVRKIAVIKNKLQNINLDDANIIVSAGRGIQTPQNLELIKDFANLIGASLGASRALVDEGWIDYSHQIGQTGKNVRPKIYFACGISGAVQHLAGMLASRNIIAINKDPEAPIFKVASIGMVGDLNQIIPELMKEIKKHRNMIH